MVQPNGGGAVVGFVLESCSFLCAFFSTGFVSVLFIRFECACAFSQAVIVFECYTKQPTGARVHNFHAPAFFALRAHVGDIIWFSFECFVFFRAVLLSHCRHTTPSQVCAQMHRTLPLHMHICFVGAWAERACTFVRSLPCSKNNCVVIPQNWAPRNPSRRHSVIVCMLFMFFA